jgi:hypothetical protein
VTEAHPDAPGSDAGEVLHLYRLTWRDGICVLATLGLTLGSFTFTGSLVLLLYTRLYPESDVLQIPGGLLFRVLFFGLVTILSACLLYRLRQNESGTPPRRGDPHEAATASLSGAGAKLPSRDQKISVRAFGVLLLLLCVVGAFLCIKIGDYPWAAPDEVHHLNVAKNLASQGSYASGHPNSGLRYFDSFDSVGPTVIVPLALAFKGMGVSLLVGRLVIVFFFIALCLAAFQFNRARHDVWTGIATVALLFGAFSSIYLGRTVYGEVPAFLYLLLGLLAWQQALSPSAPGRWGIAAGVLVASAVLAKTIVILVAFSFLGAWAYDRATFRTIRWRHVLLPVVGGSLVVLSWGLFQRLHGPADDVSGGVLDIYQHYLLFGTGSLVSAISNSVVLNPVAHAAWAVVTVVSLPIVFRHRYSASGLVLYLYAIFMLYWWYFFTPGQIPRYLWNAHAILSLFAAPWLIRCVRLAVESRLSRRARIAFCCAAVLLAAPGLRWIQLMAVEIATKEEMVVEYATIDQITGLPPECRVVSTDGRLPGLLNFFADQAIDRGNEPLPLLADYDVVIARDSPSLRAELPPGTRLKTAGEFVLLSSSKSLE